MTGRNGKQKGKDPPDKPLDKSHFLKTPSQMPPARNNKRTQAESSISPTTTTAPPEKKLDSNIQKIKSLQNLSTVGKHDYSDMSKWAAEIMIRQTREKLRTTTAPTPKIPSQENPAKDIASPKSSHTQAKALTVAASSQVTPPQPQEEYKKTEPIIPDPDSTDTEDEMTSEVHQYCTLTGLSTDISKISKVKVVRELGGIINDFRVNYDRENKSIKVRLNGMGDVEVLKGMTSLNSNDIQIKHETPILHTQPQPSQNTNNSGNSRTTSWGKFFSHDLFECEDEELLEQMQIENENIILAKRIFKGGFERKATRLIRIKFGTPSTPDKVFCCSEAYSVTTYTPPPTKCSNCKKFGHIAKDCRSQWACNRCAKTHDRHYNCEQHNPIPSCVYCGSGHGSNDPQCPKYLKEKEIIELSHENNVSYPQARNEIDSGKRSYASTLRMSNPNRIPPQNINHGTSTLTTTSQNRLSTSIQTKEIGTECPPIQTDIRNSLSNHIQSEIQNAIENPLPGTKIISSTIPRATVICPKPLTSILNSISNTMDSVYNSNNKDLAEFYSGIHSFSTALDIINAKLEAG